VELARRLGGDEHALTAARLAKADQASELVREFADLEGHIGANYAQLAGYPEEVCLAIDEQYLPDAADALLPSSQGGRVLAAADKLDTLATVFGLGKRPTGSRDPYGLRRAAIGLCRLAVEGGLRVDRSLLPDDAREFVEERLEGLLDVPVEFVRAARASAARDLGGVARLARTLHSAEQTPEFAAVYTAYERAHRLAGRAEQEAAGSLDPALLEDDAERELAEALSRTVVEPNGDLTAAAELAPHVDRFFDEVLVMAPDERLRANRLRLLLDVRDRLGRLGDFSQIPR
jgi:glycyl-tRNA synthetase beta chain